MICANILSSYRSDCLPNCPAFTHTYEVVDVPEQEQVDAFIPYRDFSNRMDLDEPMSTCITAGPDWNTEFRYQQHLAILNAAKRIDEIDAQFGARFGRTYGGMVEAYRCEDAEAVMVTLGSVAGTTRIVVDALRGQGHKVGMLRLRCLRPFPIREVIAALGRVKAVGVLEKDIDFGYEGTVLTNVNSALARMDHAPRTQNFIAGLGGRAISKKDIEDMFMELLSGKPEQTVEFVKLRCVEA